MRRSSYAILIAATLPLMLGGCESSGVWDSANNVSDRFQDMLHDFSPFGTSKKPLPGERRAVFPEGVPGVQQGVPSELMRNPPPGEEAQTATVTPPPAAKTNTKTKKAAAKTKTQARAPESTDPAEDEVWPPPPRR